ncbi:torsin-1A-like [Paramormyrops kingsleyae]|uniref:torsin-1A-like n=1 Tax=Paramormyrops kingsleyae TaxID=1676925 RepID=UPI003B96C157
MQKTFIALYLLPAVFVKVNAFESFTEARKVLEEIAKLGKTTYSFFQETCGDSWIDFNSTGLQVDLEQKFFGQHIASKVLLKAITDFANNKTPKKPLVLSLHGGTGTGKSFVSQLIASNIYKKGMSSSFVHQFVATVHFPHKSKIDIYKTQLQQWVKGNVSSCDRSMFIFDEMNKMPPGLIDSIKPFLDYYDNLDGVSYRRAIFIFLSEAGGERIKQVAFEFWKNGKDREEIQLSDLEENVSLEVFNNQYSGFLHSSLIDEYLIDFYIPFLPLEYRHVRMCALAEMANQNVELDEDIADEAAKAMIYSPQDERVFSSMGCKTIRSKLVQVDKKTSGRTF